MKTIRIAKVVRAENQRPIVTANYRGKVLYYAFINNSENPMAEVMPTWHCRYWAEKQGFTHVRFDNTGHREAI